jgi:hypothetical protein
MIDKVGNITEKEHSWYNNRRQIMTTLWTGEAVFQIDMHDDEQVLKKATNKGNE